MTVSGRADAVSHRRQTQLSLKRPQLGPETPENPRNSPKFRRNSAPEIAHFWLVSYVLGCRLRESLAPRLPRLFPIG